MLAERLQPGDTIGIICPSHIADAAEYQEVVQTIESLGFRAKLGENIFKSTYGYRASEQERADDLNNMILDDEVKMILFGGGMGAAELPPLIDFESIRRRPKLICGFSDGTSILNPVYAHTGLVTYYGLGARTFSKLSYADYRQFNMHFVQGNEAQGLAGNGKWIVLGSGRCEGILVGGCPPNFPQLLGGDYFPFDPQEKYILFLEDHKKFSDLPQVSVHLSLIEQSKFMRNISGLLFGHYDKEVPPDLLRRLERFSQAHGIPVAYTDQFGHFTDCAVLRIGVRAALDTSAQTLAFQ